MEKSLENDLSNMHTKAEKTRRAIPKMLATAAAIATVALAAASANATIYYVSSSGGSDGNNGTSTSTPWQTTAKVNGFALNAGDQVLFKRGDSWHSSITCSRSGASGNPITFADYGTGTKPTFWGSDVLQNSGFTSAGTNEYQITWTGAAPQGVLINHYQGVANTWLVAGNPASPGFFSYSGTTLTIYSATNPATDGKTYTVDTREDIIYSNAQSHLVFTNLIAEEATDPTQGYVIRVMNSSDVTLNACEAYDGSKHLFGFINSTGVVANNCNAQWGLPFNNTNGCTFYVSFADTSGPFTNCTSTYNNCSGSGFTDGGSGFYQYFVCHGNEQGPITFTNCNDNGGLFSVLQDVSTQTVSITGGSITDNDLESFCNNMTVTGTNFVGKSTVDCYATGDVFQNLRMINLTEPSGGKTGYWTAFLMRSGANNNIIRFCTVVLDPSNGNNTTCLAMAGANSHTQVYGNIFDSDDFCVINDWNGAPTSADITSDYNVYNPSPTFQPFATGGSWSFATWKTNTGQDAHTVAATPGFNNASGGDYTPASTSPAIDLVPLTFAYPSTDYAGVSRPHGSANDAGCYQYTGGGATTPYNVNAIYTSGTTFASNGGLDSFGNAYLSSQLGTSAVYNGGTFTFGTANALDGWSNVTVNLPAGTYTTLDMVGTSSGGIASSQTFLVHYTDATTSSFTISMKDWTSTTTFAGETKVVTMANYAKFDGTAPAGNHVLHGYTFTLTGHAVQSITLPAARGVVVLGFRGH